jgi:asparagine synthase (glutamine-hydrolysing)
LLRVEARFDNSAQRIDAVCGIAGFVRLGAGAPEPDAAARLRAMIATIRHRGPDDEGVWFDGVCGLAHARLSILDLSPAGHQPMGSPDGRIWVSYNGEIYNYRELRQELEQAGHVFHGRSDTEVLVHAYAAWGDAAINRLRGMFAIALWDRARQRLLLVRDRFGKKPLYWCQTKNALVFGSEIKAILAWPGIDRAPDLAAIDEYLSLQYVPAPRTAFAAVRKLPAAHLMAVAADRAGDAVGATQCYWRLPRPEARPTAAPARAIAGELVERLSEAVRLRLISDVPLGAFLSGGVDSSAIVALMSRLGAAPVKTFSIGFANAAFDETRYARLVAQRYHTDHQEFMVEPDAVAVIPRLVWHYGEPFADPSMVPTWYVSQLAREKVTVALSGDGGDEAFLGYGRYSACRGLSQIDAIPHLFRRGAAAAIERLPNRWKGRYQRRLNAIGGLLGSSDRRASQRYAFTITFFMDHQKREGYGDAMTGFLEGSALDRLETYFAEAPSLVSGANWADIHTYLPDDLMVKVDVASMAHALETRAPLLDHTLMEWAVGLPERVRMAGGETKAIFKKAMEPFLPGEVLYRRKMGFGCPVGDWFRHELKEMAHDLLLSPAATARQIFRRDYVERLLADHTAGRVEHDTRLWALLMLELWFRMWVEQPTDAALLRPALAA